MKRRDFFTYMGAVSTAIMGAVSTGIYSNNLFGISLSTPNKSVSTDLKVQTARFVLREQPTEKMVSLLPDAPPPILFGQQGKPMVLNVINTLKEYTSMHWHGIRLPNAMDGVPYLTQPPIEGGKSFLYEFTSFDAGTYWYHPHCMTMRQMASGLTGALIIRENNDPGFDGDQVINLRDFLLDKNDALRTPYTLRGAARAGTLGNVMTANWLQSPVYDYPTGGLVRLRLLNTDTTRIYRMYLSTESNSQIIAWDGHPVEHPLPMPNAQHPIVLGPGQRVDIALVMPSAEGQKIDIIANVPGGKKVMASLRANGMNIKRSLAELTPLSPNPIAQPDISVAQLREFVFGWSPDGTIPHNGFCGSLGKNFWSINRIAWAGDDVPNTGPLATLERGKSYIFRLRNESPNLHPIHLHGLTFKPLRSNKREIAPNWTDTVLLLRNEVVDIALVADNPGDWAFHCHVIEHQKTGLAGYIRVR